MSRAEFDDLPPTAGVDRRCPFVETAVGPAKVLAVAAVNGVV